MKVRTTLPPGIFNLPPPSLISVETAVKEYVVAGFIDHLRILFRAGGQWRSHAKAHEWEVQGWDAETYKEWMGMVRKGEGSKAGLGVS